MTTGDRGCLCFASKATQVKVETVQQQGLCYTFAVQHKINTHNLPRQKYLVVSCLSKIQNEAVGLSPNRGAAMSFPQQQGGQSDLDFTCTWSEWPPGLSGAFAY